MCGKAQFWYDFLIRVLPTPWQRSKDDPQRNAHAVDDNGDVASDEDDGVDVRGDHLPARWLRVDKFSDNPSVENASAEIFQTSAIRCEIFALQLKSTPPPNENWPCIIFILSWFWAKNIQIIMNFVLNILLRKTQMSRMTRRKIWLGVSIAGSAKDLMTPVLLLCQHQCTFYVSHTFLRDLEGSSPDYFCIQIKSWAQKASYKKALSKTRTNGDLCELHDFLW